MISFFPAVVVSNFQFQVLFIFLMDIWCNLAQLILSPHVRIPERRGKRNCETMEPLVLQPDLGSLGPIGRQEAKPDKVFFPAVIHLWRANGKKPADGWCVVASAKASACHTVDFSCDRFACRHQAGSWVGDGVERKRLKVQPEAMAQQMLLGT